jgi:hypothetical protein
VSDFQLLRFAYFAEIEERETHTIGLLYFWGISEREQAAHGPRELRRREEGGKRLRVARAFEILFRPHRM